MYKRGEKFRMAVGRVEGFSLLKSIIICQLMCVAFAGFLNTAHSGTGLSNDDVIKIEVSAGKVVAVNTLTNIRVAEKLEAGETVISALAKGEVGAVLTDRRLLGFNERYNSWAVFDTFFSKAVFPKEIKVSSSMAVAVAERRVYAFTCSSHKWEFELVSFLEKTLTSEVNDNLIFVLTSGRLLGFSFAKKKWISQNLLAVETEAVASTGDYFVTVTTHERILTFDAENGKWLIEFRRPDPERKSTELLTPPVELQVGSPLGDKALAPEELDSGP